MREVGEAIVVEAWAEPRHLPEGGGQAQILVRVQKRGGRRIPGVEVRLRSSEGTLFSGGNVLVTDAQGMTRDRLTTRHAATLTLNAGGTRVSFEVKVGQALAQADPQAQAESGAIAVLREFDQLAAQALWPGFEPRTIAVEVYDGANTYLFHHPRPAEGFVEEAALPGAFVYRGQHETVRANTGTEVNGIPTATADLSRSQRTLREQASLLIHEAFHVYGKRSHPEWPANEATLFVYPLDNPELLAERRLETRALVRALAAPPGPEATCAAAAALAARERRAARMPAEAIAYERGTELNEGLAQYVEYRSIGRPPVLSEADFPAGQIRQRGYATGQAWAVLLERLAPGWEGKLDGSLDARLRASLETAQCPDEEAASLEDETTRARRDVAELVASRTERERGFLNAPGWQLEILAGKEPLWMQAFDPLNVTNLGGNRVLHTRWLKLGNGSGSLEVLKHASLTEGVGPHPLFNGAKRLIATGLAEPKVTESDGTVSIEVEGVKARLAGTVERDGNLILVRVR